MPAASLDDIRALLPGALAIALLPFPDAILIARALGAKNRYEIRPNQELVALAAANFAAGLFLGFPVGASQSRTVINDASGGKAQMVSLVASGLLIAFLLALTPVLKPLPTVALAAILVSAGIHLVEVRYRTFFRISPRAGWLALIVALGVLIVGVITGSDNNYTNGIGVGWSTDEAGTYGEESFVRRWTDFWSFLPFVLDEGYS